MSKVKLVLIIVLVVVFVIIAIQNTESVQTTLLFFTVEMPRAALIGLTLLVGFAVGVLSASKLVKTGKSAGSK